MSSRHPKSNYGGKAGVLEGDVEEERDKNGQGHVKQSMGEWREGGARGEPGAGAAMQRPRPQPAR